MRYNAPMHRRTLLTSALLLATPLQATTPHAPPDPQRLTSLLDEVAAGADNLHGVVIERGGVLLGECYRDGLDRLTTALWSTPAHFDADTLHDVRSISKSVVSLLWGIAQARGLVPPLDTPALDLLPALADLRRDGRQAITLAHLFDMTSGLAWTEPGRFGLLDDDEFSLYWRADPARFLFDRPLTSAPGTRWQYNSGGTAVLAQLLAERTGQPLPAWADTVLWAPLGVTRWAWSEDFRDRPLAFTGLRLRPRDLARLGRLVLDQGRWQGREVVPVAWLAESLQPRVDVPALGPVLTGLRYGRFWWHGQVPDPRQAHRGSTLPWIAGFGNGGQRLYLVPALDLVIAVAAGAYGEAAVNARVDRLLREVVAAVGGQSAPL